MTGVRQQSYALFLGLILATWVVLCLTGLRGPLSSGQHGEVAVFAGILVVLAGVVFGMPAPGTEAAAWTWLQAAELWLICGGTALVAGRWDVGLLLVAAGCARMTGRRGTLYDRAPSLSEQWAEAWRRHGSVLLGIVVLLLLLGASKAAGSTGGLKAHRLELGVYGVLIALAGIAWAGRADGVGAFSSETCRLLKARQASPARLAFLALAPWCGFLALTYLVQLPQLASLDHSLVHLVYHQGDRSLRSFMRAISNAGGEDLALVWIPLIALALVLFRHARSLRFFLAANFGVFGIETLTKTLTFRARPDLTHGSHFDSFPSGHTLSAVILAGGLWLILWPSAARKGRWLLTVAAITWPVLMGSSRVYLGRHYFTDVVGSWLLGTGWLLVGMSTLLVLDRKK